MSKLRNRWPLFLLVALLLPMCFIGLRHTHDWGDDFAQYLVQARDLSEGHLISAADQVRNFENYGPAPKGLGFSLLLAPLWAASGNTVFPYFVLMSVITLLLCIALYEFLCRDFGWLSAMLASLLFAYDRHVLHAKSEIMPDLLLTLLVLLCLLVLRRNDARRWWLLPLLVCFMILVKSAGWVLYVAVVINVLVTWRKRPPEASVRIKHVLWTISIPLAMAFLVPFALSRNVGSNAVWYANVFFDGNMFRTIGSNVIAYAGAFEHFFEQELPMWMNHLLVLVLLVMIVLGAVVRLRRRADAGDLFALLWLIILLCYPYANSPDRFLLPVLPFVLRYLLEGLRWIAALVRLPEGPVVSSVLGGFLLLHVVTVRFIVQQNERPIAGPYSADAQEAFAVLKARTPTTGLIGTARPWAVHLLTDRTTVWLPTPGESAHRVSHAPDPTPDFILLGTDPRHRGMYDQLLREEVVNDSAHWINTWRNSSFVLFERRPSATVSAAYLPTTPSMNCARSSAKVAMASK
ncbi:MAG: hypothetical protein IPG74_01655 [Flavobacteriales bacterium]|nr:hypothetical protein [Flavobacteriales bacterium]